jgi:hypothetical protein
MPRYMFATDTCSYIMKRSNDAVLKRLQQGITKIRITSDGIHYGYELQRIYSTLFLADGLP